MAPLDGNFKRLFNMLAEGGGESPEYGVPDCFEALQSHSNLVSRIPGYLAPGPYKSSSVKAVEVKVEAQGPAYAPYPRHIHKDVIDHPW